MFVFFFFSSRRRHTRWPRDWSSDVCSSDLRDQFFCSTCAPSFLLPERDRVKVTWCSVHHRNRCSLMNSLPLSLSIPTMGNGKVAMTCCSASKTHLAALLRTDRLTVHPVAMSVTVSVKQKSPEAFPPS